MLDSVRKIHFRTLCPQCAASLRDLTTRAARLFPRSLLNDFLLAVLLRKIRLHAASATCEHFCRARAARPEHNKAVPYYAWIHDFAPGQSLAPHGAPWRADVAARSCLFPIAGLSNPDCAAHQADTKSIGWPRVFDVIAGALLALTSESGDGFPVLQGNDVES